MAANRSASAVSLFTAVAACVFLAFGIVGLVRHWAPWFVVVWCVALVVVIAFNIWATRGPRR
ncbi:hypothetical protein ACFQ1S_26760 [Kibdelosporangium lantanae]|uniref:DUF4175 domain-containing protein n=1 Tax=Kibdelosporangium lantanae TaxID=1497396 RepID=A0ABW3MIG8_9PSEU